METVNLILGTANWCNDYGKRLERDECFRLMDKAKELGIYALDTAVAYGGSEAVIKEWLDRGNQMTVFSKGTNEQLPTIGDYKLLHNENQIKTCNAKLWDGFSIYDSKWSGWLHGWVQAPFNPLNYEFRFWAHNDNFIARSIFVGGHVWKGDREDIARLTYGFLRSHSVKNCVFGVESVEELEMNVRIARDCRVVDTRNLS